MGDFEIKNDIDDKTPMLDGVDDDDSSVTNVVWD